MDGRNEIASAGGVPGNRHATTVPTAFSPPARLGRDPLGDRRAGINTRRHEMRSLAQEFAAQRNSTGPRHESWDEARSRDSAGAWNVAPVPSRRAVLRRALRQGLLRPAPSRVTRGDVAVDNRAARSPAPIKSGVELAR
jgi:hypothetical protein